jgi:hypothetical protein
MAQNTTIIVAGTTWVQLTDANVTSLTFQNHGTSYALIKGTADATAPTDFAGAVRYNPGQGELNVFLSDLFPGISANRVWAYAPEKTQVMVSHA